MVERIIVGPLHTNTYVVSTGKKDCVLIDPGDEVELLIERLEAINMVPRAIIFTHGHLDHTSAAQGIISWYRDRGEVGIGIHPEDAEFLGTQARTLNHETFAMFGEGGETYFNNTFSELPKVTFFLEHGDTVPDTDLKVIHTPGHTKGSISLYSELRNYVFTGDTLFFKGIGKTSFAESSETSLMESIEDRLLTLPPETRMFPGHGPNTSIEREKRDRSYSTDHSMF
ncbi:MAG TPA: MBL fold metallo-hydrolase [Spirochaetia bacterium]|nr:MBL fold metallo-hydrolase [Spirochaetia bacterium]